MRYAFLVSSSENYSMTDSWLIRCGSNSIMEFRLLRLSFMVFPNSSNLASKFWLIDVSN